MTTDIELLERYGRTGTRRRRRVLWVVGGALAALAVGLLAWFTVGGTVDSLQVDDLGMTVVDERTVSVEFQVTGPADRDIACALEALDVEFGVVGWLVVEYPATGEHARAFRETVPTVAGATTGLVNACWVT